MQVAKYLVQTRQLVNINDRKHINSYVYYRVKRGMYCLKQGIILTYKLPIKRLAACSCYPIPLTNGCFEHNTKKIVFALCVDNFGVTYHSQLDLQQ